MSTGRFKVTAHRGPSIRTRVAFPTYYFGRMKSASLPPVLHGNRKTFGNSNFKFQYLVICISYAILIYTGVLFGSLIRQDMLDTLRMEREYIDPSIAQRQKVYNFLISSASKNYNQNALAWALTDLNKAYNMDPKGFQVNFLLTNTLGAFCQQKGIYCDVAEIYYNYMVENNCMDDKWIRRRQFSLGIQVLD